MFILIKIIIVKNLNGKLRIIDNKVDQANITALFDNNENLHLP